MDRRDLLISQKIVVSGLRGLGLTILWIVYYIYRNSSIYGEVQK